METCYSPTYWKGRAQEAFHNWVDEQPVNWAVTTFTCYTENFPNRMSSRYPCTIKSIEAGYGDTLEALDRKHLKTSQRKKGVKLLRVPYLGGDRKNAVPYHIHSLIELPQGVPIDELGGYLNKIFQSKMESELVGHKHPVVKTSVWCKPFEKDENFFKYCERSEGTELSVGLDKVVFSQLIMKPPCAGAI